MIDGKTLPFTLRVRKLKNNPLLQRRQCCLDIYHLNRANVSKKELQAKLAQQFKSPDPQCVVVFGFGTAFGGGRSTGFACIYDNVAAAMRFECNYRLARMGLKEKVTKKGRRAVKELKNRKKKVRGIAKAKTSGGKK